MNRLVALLMLVAMVSAAGIQFSSPSGNYEHGVVPVSATFIAGEKITFELLETGKMLETKTVQSATSMYSTSFYIDKRGTYTIKATASFNGTDYQNTTEFNVTTSQIYITILKPLAGTYSEGTIPLEITATMDDAFLHNADVTAKIGNRTYDLPESQNSYRGKAELAAGDYIAVFTVSNKGQNETASIAFTVSGEIIKDNETVYLPGPKALTITRVSPTRAQYALGEEVEITIQLFDSQNQRLGNATVTAVIQTPKGTEETLPLYEKLVAGRPVFTNDYVFAEEGFYEVMITASKPGYQDAEVYMPSIKAGEEAPELPKDVYCQQGICVRVESPLETETYPDGSAVELKVQIIEQASTKPVSDATVTVKYDNTTQEMTYDWNGYYYNTTGNMTEGEHSLVFIVSQDDILIEKTIALHISPKHLTITPVYPVPGSNETKNFVTLQVKITDQQGEVVSNANVRAIITTPFTGTHNIPLSRNPETGYYENEYTFSDAGQHTIRIVASRIGYVSSEAIYSFDVMLEKKEIQLTEEDVVIAALILGVLIIIATLWKALL